MDRTEHSRLLGHCSHVDDDEMDLVCRESNTKKQNKQSTGVELWTLREVDDECLAHALGQDGNDDTRSVQMQDHVFVNLCQDDFRCGQHFLSEI